MKTPARPPNYRNLLAQVSTTDRFSHVLNASLPDGSLTNRYLPWDALRFKTPPQDLTSEEWWFAIRLVRRSAQRSIALLRDQEGVSFSYLLPDEVLAGVESATRNASGSITVSEQVANPATRDRYVVSSLIEEAITSSQLEGAATSRRVAKEMIRSGREPRDRSERMIFNNFRAMQRILELRGQDMTPALVCELHRIVTDGTLDDPARAGRVQDDDAERIAVWGDGDQLLYRPPAVGQLPERLDRLCEFANGGGEGYLPPVLRAITVHFMMGYDHYFEDGNGRTARALFYWCMLRNGFWLTEFLTISSILKKAPSAYARSFLLTEEDEGDLTHFFIHHLNVLNRAIEELHKYLARKAEELREVQQAMSASPGTYNYRQLALLEHATKSPGASYTVASHSLSHHVSGEAARQDLRGLERLGLLVRMRVGKRFAWSPVDDLRERLSES